MTPFHIANLQEKTCMVNKKTDDRKACTIFNKHPTNIIFSIFTILVIDKGNLYIT